VDAIDQALATADRAWRAYGVRRADRAAPAADLRLDLESAAADGVGPAQLFGEDVPTFARRLADESGVRREAPEFARLLGTASIGAGLGVAAALAILALAYPLAVRLVDQPRDFHIPVQVAVIVFYGLPAAVVVAGAVIAVRVHLREVPRIRATANAMAVLLPLAGIVITPVTGAVVIARRWALREPAERTEAATA
jgi:hypothetical protein